MYTLIKPGVICLFILLQAVMVSAQSKVRDDFNRYYKQFSLEGSFVMLDQKNSQYIFCNQPQAGQAFIPASTFKICNSLIGLETGVIRDENFVIQWDSIQRSVPGWNQSQDLRTAFQHSTVWYYQSLARQVGAERMKYWLDKAGYGNADTSGGIDQFWLSGGLRITPMQQIDFLQRLHENRLPFSQRTMDLVKKIMVAEQTEEYTLFAKTGWSMSGTMDIGWYVGYIETKDNVYYFANCIQGNGLENKNFGLARKEIVFRILHDMKIRPDEKLKITHLTGDYYVFTTYKNLNGKLFPANGMYKLTQDGAVMADTPWDTTQFQPLLDSIWQRHQQKVVLCIATHSHDDRTAGLEYYSKLGIKTYTSKPTQDLCRLKDEKQAEFIFLDDTIFHVGGQAFETYHPGAGHTEDNIVLWFGDARILYGGCFIKSTESPDLGYTGEANLPAWRQSVRKVMRKYPDAEFVIPGHFGWKSSKGLQHTLKLLKENSKSSQ